MSENTSMTDTLRAGILQELQVNGDRMNELATLNADSAKSDASREYTEKRDKAPLESFDSEEVRNAVKAFRDNEAIRKASAKADREKIAEILGFDDADSDFDRDAAKKEYQSLRAERAKTVDFARTVLKFTDADINSLSPVKSWSGGTAADAAAAAVRPRFDKMTYNLVGSETVVSVEPRTSGELAKRLNKVLKDTDGWAAVDSSVLTRKFLDAAGGDIKSADTLEIVLQDNNGDDVVTVNAVPAKSDK